MLYNLSKSTLRLLESFMFYILSIAFFVLAALDLFHVFGIEFPPVIKIIVYSCAILFGLLEFIFDMLMIFG